MKACKDCRWWTRTLSPDWGRCWSREVYDRLVRGGVRLLSPPYVRADQKPCDRFTDKEVRDEHSGH
jgi:hypothetical protein